MHISFHSGIPILTSNCHSRPITVIANHPHLAEAWQSADSPRLSASRMSLRIGTWQSLSPCHSREACPILRYESGNPSWEVVFSNQTVNEQINTLGLTSFTHFVSHSFKKMCLRIVPVGLRENERGLKRGVSPFYTDEQFSLEKFPLTHHLFPEKLLYFANVPTLTSLSFRTMPEVVIACQNKIGRFLVASGKRLAFKLGAFTMPSLYFFLTFFWWSLRGGNNL